MVSLEGSAALPGHSAWPGEAAGTEPALSEAAAHQARTGRAGSRGRREGHPYGFFFRPPATGPAATRDSCAAADPRGNASARKSAGSLSSASASGSGVGRRRSQDPDRASHFVPRQKSPVRTAETVGQPDKRDLLTALRRSISFSLPTRRGRGNAGAAHGSLCTLFFHEGVGESSVLRWVQESSLQLGLAEFGDHYGRYRLHLPEAERAMARSLERYGQLSPVCLLYTSPSPRDRTRSRMPSSA